MMARRAQIEIQFHWILALVGGILFLLFFFILLRSILHSGGVQQTQQTSFAVQSIIKSAANNPDTFKVADVPDARYRFVCAREDGQFTDAYVQIDDTSYGDRELGLRYVPLFSAPEVQGDQLFLLTTAWKVPFPVTNLLFVSNNRTRYVLVGDTRTLAELVSQLHLDGFDVDIRGLGSLPTYKDMGYDRYRFVFYDRPASIESIPAAFHDKATAIKVTPNPDGEGGTLRFYDDITSTTHEDETYLGDAQLLAGVFSTDHADYDCNMFKAEERLGTAVKALQWRLQTLMTVPDTDVSPACEKLYTDLGAATLLSNYLTQGRDARPQLARQLDELNTRLFSEGCPSLA